VTIQAGRAPRIGRRIARFLGKVLLVVLALYVLFFSLLGAAFVVAMIVGLGMVLTGHGPERTEEGVVVVIIFAVGIPLALLAFAMLSLPGFAFVVTTVRSLWRNESDLALKDIRRAMTSGDPHD
jgi:membrane-bound ClpP family serine protease